MLHNLLRKDLLLNVRHFWGFLPFFLWIAWAVQEPGMLEMSTVVAAFAGTLTATTVVAREDKFHATALLYSLPIRRRTVVASRFVVALVAGTTSFLLAALLAAVLPWSPHAVSRIFDPRTVVFVLALVGGTVAVMMPFVMRFGLIGIMVFMLVLQLAGMAAFVITATFGASDGLRSAIKSVAQAITGLHQGLATPIVAVETVFLAAAGLWLSYGLSVVMAERRDA